MSSGTHYISLQHDTQKSLERASTALFQMANALSRAVDLAEDIATWKGIQVRNRDTR